MDSLSLLLAGGISVPLPVPEGRIKYGWVAGTRIFGVAYEQHLGDI